ncbi:MAG: large subunit ribosomal protein [Thermoplasmata archaeon]|jgi:large subunit ribosomal protein L15|nr:large subunit ribosomal protein [Thermoplasmata archaeon]
MASGGKAKKMRGNHTHGRGKKAGRGAGLAGGRGRAGANKHRFLMLQILGGKHEHMAAKRWGRIGFKYRSRDGNPKPETVNVGDLALRFPGMAEVDLKAQGIGKLLGSGEIAHKVTVKVDHASAGAIEKVKAAGGQVTVLVAKVEKVQKPAGKPDAKGAPKPGAPPSAAKQAAPSKDAKPAQGKPAGDKPAGKPAGGDKPQK